MRELTLLLALALAAPAAAGVVSRDLFEPGDGLLTYDDVNQREWVDLTVSTGLYPHEIDASLMPNGPLHEFRLATENDVRSLFEMLEAPWLESLELDAFDDDGFSKIGLTEIFGWNVQLSGGILGSRRYAAGYVVEEASTAGNSTWSVSGSVLLLDIPSRPIPGAINQPSLPLQHPVNVIYTEAPLDFGISQQFYAYWLYRDAAPVPEPTTACLTLAACLAGWRFHIAA